MLSQVLLFLEQWVKYWTTLDLVNAFYNSYETTKGIDINLTISEEGREEKDCRKGWAEQVGDSSNTK